MRATITNFQWHILCCVEDFPRSGSWQLCSSDKVRPREEGGCAGCECAESEHCCWRGPHCVQCFGVGCFSCASLFHFCKRTRSVAQVRELWSRSPKEGKKTCRWGTIFLLLYLVIIKITNSRKALGYRVSSIHSTQVTMRKYEKRVHHTVFLPCLPIYPCLRDRSTAYVPGKARKSLNGVSPLCYRSFHTRADWSTWAGMDNYFTIS